MKLIVQIPCYNEEATLAQTVADIPREIEGINEVEILVIDDGSTDRTQEVARTAGVDHVIRNSANQGLARSFREGLDACLKLGADIIVNTDGDNQYAGRDIPKLVRPILDGRADLVIGDRQTASIPHFSPLKKFFQWLGSNIVRRLSGGLDVPDAVSGFRAITRDAAFSINIVSSFSYTIEMLIQAGKKRLAVTSVPIHTNEVTRESRLFTGIPSFILKSGTTVLRMFTMYKPLQVFSIIGLLLMLIGLVPMVRFLVFYFSGEGAGHIQSLIIGGAFIVIGFITFVIALLADLINFNRRLLEITLEKTRRMELMLEQGKDAQAGTQRHGFPNEAPDRETQK
jgi:glycosyltransferase involved in cell wall biosynthesis